MSATEIYSRCAMAELPDPASEERAPEWIELLPTGGIKGRDGRVFVLDDPKGVLERSLTPGADLPIDYEHQGDDPSRRTNGTVPAAGWITQLEIRDGAIWGRVNWTATAANMIGAREYRYVSPVLLHNRDGRVLRLLGAALVHRPNLELKALASQEPPMSAHDRSATLAPIAEALGLNAEKATTEDIVAAISARTEPNPAKFMPVEAVQELLKAHGQNVAAMSQERAERKVNAAVEDGYITPAMRGWALSLCTQDPESFDAFMASALPAYAHLGEKISRNARSLSDVPEARHSPEAREIASNLGIDPARLDE